MTRKNKAQKKGFSLRGRVTLSFALFVLIVLTVLWLFQTVLLDDLYRSVRLRDLDRCADTFALAAESEGTSEGVEFALGTTAGELAKRYETCLTAYRLENGIGGRIATCFLERHVNPLCYIHNVRSDDFVVGLYRNAVENGGSYTARISLAELFGRRGKGGADDSAENFGESVVTMRVVQNGGCEYLLLLNAELLPLDSTTKTLRMQLLWISVILLAVAVILGVILSGRISKPIREMSEEASKLALGDYNVNFDGGGCRETENLSATLNRAAYELSKLDKMQKDLIANVSHDLRTPLTMIAGYSEAMRDLPGEATPENMQIVIDETNRLTSLVNDMLEISRYQGGVQTLQQTRFGFTDVIRTTLGRYAKLRERDGYTITFEADEDVFVYADEGRILQVIYNLINNAVNYTGADKTVTVRQTVSRETGTVTLEVIDTGDGIPEEELPLVWERYYKAHDFHKRANMGTGLGLSIVKSILVLHGAPFGVQSRVGEGSNFWFTLRLAEESSEEA